MTHRARDLPGVLLSKFSIAENVKKMFQGVNNSDTGMKASCCTSNSSSSSNQRYILYQTVRLLDQVGENVVAILCTTMGYYYRVIAVWTRSKKASI